MSRAPVIVLGMHRSGTSMATALLASGGLHIGARLLGEHASNPRGHYEDEDFVDVNRAVLRRLGLDPDGWLVDDVPPIPGEIVARGRALVADKLRSGQPWGWKDPRTVPLLPLWRAAAPDAAYAIAYRAPWEVVDSLLRRGDATFAADPDRAVAVWTHYNRLLLDLALALPGRCVLWSADAIVTDPAGWVAAVAGCSGLALRPPDDSVVEPDLLHREQARDRAGTIARYFPDAMSLYADLERHAGRPSGVSPGPVSDGAERRQAMRDWAAAAVHRRTSSVASPVSAADEVTVDGWCACCRRDTSFIEAGPWLRDQFLCQQCRSIPRFRAVNHTLDTWFAGWEQAAVHEFAPPNDFVSRHCAHYSFSPWTEGDVRLNQGNGERLDRLSFADGTFDLVVTQDVLEHVFDPRAAVREIMRVVKPGGAHVFTTPKHKSLRATRQRARLDSGRVVHLLAAQYHGDALSDDRELVTWDYGDDFEMCLTGWCGLPTVSHLVRDRRLGLDGEYLEVFVTRRPARSFA